VEEGRGGSSMAPRKRKTSTKVVVKAKTRDKTVSALSAKERRKQQGRLRQQKYRHSIRTKPGLMEALRRERQATAAVKTYIQDKKNERRRPSPYKVSLLQKKAKEARADVCHLRANEKTNIEDEDDDDGALGEGPGQEINHVTSEARTTKDYEQLWARAFQLDRAGKMPFMSEEEIDTGVSSVANDHPWRCDLILYLHLTHRKSLSESDLWKAMKEARSRRKKQKTEATREKKSAAAMKRWDKARKASQNRERRREDQARKRKYTKAANTVRQVDYSTFIFDV